MPRQDHAKVSSHHFKNSKKTILGNLRNAREHYNNDVRTVKREDRISEKIDGRIAKREDKISEAIDRVVISAVVGTGVAEVVAEGNRSYILVTQKTSITQLIRSLWSKSLLFLANSLTDIMVSFFKKIYIPL